MTKILEKIKADIYKKSVQMHFDGNFYIKMDEVLQLLDKYAEQEPFGRIDDIREETYKRAVLNCMGMIDAIREEIANLTCDCINGMVNQYAVLQIIDKYTKGGAE